MLQEWYLSTLFEIAIQCSLYLKLAGEGTWFLRAKGVRESCQIDLEVLEGKEPDCYL